MNNKERQLEQEIRDEERLFDTTLRPQSLDEFIGQEKLKEKIDLFVAAAKKREEPLEHMLLCGPPGLGKTTLAHILAHEMGRSIRVTSGPAIDKAGDLAGVLTNLDEGDVLFIDEIHRLNRVVEEYLYPAMEDFSLDIILDKGANARSIRLDIKRFTLVGATTRSGMLSAPLRSRFGMLNRLEYYEHEAIHRIVTRSAELLGVGIDHDGAFEIARRSRGTPRIANGLLRRVRDFAQVKADGHITKPIADEALVMLEIDGKGLDEMDKKLLRTIIIKFDGGPVGLNTIAAAVGEDSQTIEEVYEPYLIQQGYIQRTPSGRKATHRAYQHYNFQSIPPTQDELFER